MSERRRGRRAAASRTWRSALVTASAAVLLVSCRVNRAPHEPSVPIGPVYGHKDSSYSLLACATDPNNDDLIYRFDWGDGDTSYWGTTWSVSGNPDSATHTWRRPGPFGIRAQARDELGAVSPWSEPHTLNVNGPTWVTSLQGEKAVCAVDSTCRFWALAADPDDDSTRCRFAWGDGDTSAWGEWHASGESDTGSHCWSKGDTYWLRAQAQDERLTLSEWSDSALLLVVADPRPATPVRPEGPTVCTTYIAASYRTVTTDPAGRRLRYMFDWADGSQPGWSALFEGGLPYTGTHVFIDTGTFAVRVKAANDQGYESDWSDALSVRAILRPDPPEGSVRWSFGYAPDPESPEDSAGLASSTFARGQDGDFYLSGGDGSALLARGLYGIRRWEFPDPEYNQFATPVIAADTSILVGTRGGSLYCLDTRGVKKWELTFTAGIPSPVSLGPDGTIYVQTEDDSLFALDADTGARRWWFFRNGGMTPAVVGADGSVLVCHDDSIFALEPATGAVMWRYGTPQNIYSPPAVDPERGAAYVCDEVGNLVSLDLGSGMENRRVTVGSSPSAPVIGPDHTVYVCAAGRLYAVDPSSGGVNVLYDPPLAGQASAPAVSSDDRIYFLVASNRRELPNETDSLYAVSPDGSRRWACGLGRGGGGGVISAPKVDDNGYVYICSGTRAWCVVGSGGPAASPWPMYQHDLQNTGRARW